MLNLLETGFSSMQMNPQAEHSPKLTVLKLYFVLQHLGRAVFFWGGDETHPKRLFQILMFLRCNELYMIKINSLGLKMLHFVLHRN